MPDNLPSVNLPPNNADDYVYIRKNQLAALVKQVEKVEGELQEIADRKAATMLSGYRMGAEVNFLPHSMMERLSIRLEPLQYQIGRAHV